MNYCTKQVIDYRIDKSFTEDKLNVLGNAYEKFHDAQIMPAYIEQEDNLNRTNDDEYDDSFEDLYGYEDEELGEYDLGIKSETDWYNNILTHTNLSIELNSGIIDDILKLEKAYRINENEKEVLYPSEKNNMNKEIIKQREEEYYKIKRINDDYQNEISVLRNQVYNISRDIHHLLEFFDFSNQLVIKSRNHSDSENSFEIGINDKSLLDFISFYVEKDDKNKILHLPRFFNFYWRNLSSGEHSFLSLFSRFFSIRNKLSSNHLLIVIDEGELYFHPEWQKKWIYTVINIFEKIYPEKIIQLIVTTHSPFILSDLPSENIVLLYSDKSKNSQRLSEFNLTFGANIQELFSDAFFLRDGLTGNYSKQIINNAINEIFEKSPDEVKQKLDYYTKLFSIIGEPIVRRKCVELLNEKIALSKTDIEMRIDQLEREIRKLKEIGNNI